MIVFIAAIANIIGILLGLYLQKSIALLLFYIIFIIFIVISYKYIKRRKFKIGKYIKKTYIISTIIVAIVSSVYIIFLEKEYDTKYENIQKDIEIVGTIVDDKIEKEYKDVYKIKVETINKISNYKNTYLLLNVKKQKEKFKLLEYGNKIKIKAEYEEPTEQRNYKGFDYKAYLKSKRIYGIANTKYSNIEIIKKENVNILNLIINRFSNKVKSNIRKLLEENESNLLLGILIGDNQNLSQEIQENFRDSNLSHMLAVSGAHISYIILAINFIVLKLKIGKKKGKITLIIFLILFAILTKGTPSILRATIMTIYLTFGSLIYKKPSIIVSISVSSIIVLLFNPYNILNIGFQLSFMGTIGIILLNKIINEIVNKIYIKKIKDKVKICNPIKLVLKTIKEIIIVTLSANIMILPIIAINYNTVSLTFLISNVLTSILFGIIIILGFATVVISLLSIELARIISCLLNLLIKLLILISEFTSKLPLSKLYIKQPYKLSIIIYYSIIFILVYFYNKKKLNIINKIIKKTKKYFIVSITILSVLISIIKYVPKPLIVYFIDVGQGDSTIIVTPSNKKILIDGGGSDNSTFDIGEQVLIPYILNRRITTIDYCLITHFDSDHVKGILSVMKNLKVKNAIISKQNEITENYREFVKIVNKNKINVIQVKMGDNLIIDKYVNIDILWPKIYNILENQINNNSIVAKLLYKDVSILFTGDIEKIAEKQIVDEYFYNKILKSDILKVAHHGSKSSSIKDFIEQVNPKIALIGVGAKNTFGHPDKYVLDRLTNLRSTNL